MDDYWRESAVCATTDPEVFFPTDFNYTRSVDLAKGICAGCPVAPVCLLDTPEDDNFSVRGGLTPKERKRLRQAVA